MLFTRKDLTRIFLPLLLEQILAVTVGMFDSMMVSSAGEAAVSGVSLVDSINILLSNIFAALATGGAVVCSQFLGRRDHEAARTSAKQLYYVVFFVSSAIMAIALLFRSSLLSLIFGRIEADVMGHAQIYFLFTALSYPFLAVYNGGAAIFRAIGNSKISLYVSLGMNAVNIAGNAILIYGLGLGAAGAAIATLFSRILGAIVMLVLSYNKENPIYVGKLFRVRLNFPIIRNILHIGVPSGMENGMFQFGKLLTQSLVSTFGTAAIAANAVAHTLSSFEYAAGGAVGLTMITVIGRCVGAGEKEQAKQYVKKLMGVAYAVMLAVALLLTLFAKPIIGVYKLSAESAALALTLIFLHNVFAATIWPLAFTLPNSFRAASDVRYPMIVSVLSMWIFRVACSYVFALGLDMGVLGVWVSMMIDWVVRAILFVIRFCSGRWLTKYTAA